MSAEEQTTTSTVTSAAPSPQPLHNPAKAAIVQHPKAPLDSTNNMAGAGMGQKALLAKRFATVSNPSIVSPTDSLQTPVSAKLSQAKKKHFAKGSTVKPITFGVSKLGSADNDDDEY